MNPFQRPTGTQSLGQSLNDPLGDFLSQTMEQQRREAELKRMLLQAFGFSPIDKNANPTGYVPSGKPVTILDNTAYTRETPLDPIAKEAFKSIFGINREQVIPGTPSLPQGPETPGMPTFGQPKGEEGEASKGRQLFDLLSLLTQLKPQEQQMIQRPNATAEPDWTSPGPGQSFMPQRSALTDPLLMLLFSGALR